MGGALPREAGVRAPSSGVSVVQVIVPDGETHKGWETLNRIFDQLLAHRCERKTALIALGGGVIGDLTGFAAASYLRGRAVHPGADHAARPGGFFRRRQDRHQPSAGQEHDRRVLPAGGWSLADTSTLDTLPDRELSAGLAEVIKYGLIRDAALLCLAGSQHRAAVAREPAALAHAVRRSCELKAEIVGADERESGVRALLNPGPHLRPCDRDRDWDSAVGSTVRQCAAGVCWLRACRSAWALVGESDVARTVALFEQAKLPTEAPALGVARYPRSDGPGQESGARPAAAGAAGADRLRLFDRGVPAGCPGERAWRLRCCSVAGHGCSTSLTRVKSPSRPAIRVGARAAHDADVCDVARGSRAQLAGPCLTWRAYAVSVPVSRGRRILEDAPESRNEFQRDRDRIIHSTAFRRLEYKTQVFVNHEGDHFRTRLTHSLEVAQIARSIARTLRLNEDLTEAIALAHDLGHTPFGHAGQDALNECMRDHGGFEHNLQSLRVGGRARAALCGLRRPATCASRRARASSSTARSSRPSSSGDVGERFVRKHTAVAGGASGQPGR